MLSGVEGDQGSGVQRLLLIPGKCWRKWKRERERDERRRKKVCLTCGRRPGEKGRRREKKEKFPLLRASQSALHFECDNQRQKNEELQPGSCWKEESQEHERERERERKERKERKEKKKRYTSKRAAL